MKSLRLEDLLENQNLVDWCLNTSHQDEEIIKHRDMTITWLADGIIQLEPDTDNGLDVVVSCGIHGNETAPIEMVADIFKDLLNGIIQLECRLLLVMGNLPAMAINKRFCEENLNRLFSNKHQDNPTQEAGRAAEIEHWVERFYSRNDVKRVHLDLHTAIRGSQIEKFAIYPYQGDIAWSPVSLNWLADAGIEAVLLGHQPSGTFSYYTSATYGAMAFTLELGKALPFGDNDHSRLTQFRKATVNLLAGSTQWQSESIASNLLIFRVVDEVLRLSEADFELCLADDFLNFTSLEAGTEITRDIPASYQIKTTGHRVVFPNKNVPKGQRVALVIEPCDLSQIQ